MKNKILIIIVLIIVAIYSYRYFRQRSVFVLSNKAQTYKVFSKKSPKFLEVIIEPLDVKVNDIQKMRVKLEDSSGINWVKAKIEYDNGFNEVELKLAKEGDIYKGAWFGKWQVHSTHSKTYHTTFLAQNKKGEENSITLAWSDACVPPYGGDWTLDGNCSISGVNGVDNGNFIVPSGYTITIQNGATFAWNQGKAINLSGGTIVVSTGGQIKQTNLWMVDADNDNYALCPTQYAQDTAPTNTKRRYLIAGCDCCDSDVRANPAQTQYFTNVNNCGSWDYNCNGSIEEKDCEYGGGGGAGIRTGICTCTPLNLSCGQTGTSSCHCTGPARSCAMTSCGSGPTLTCSCR